VSSSLLTWSGSGSAVESSSTAPIWSSTSPVGSFAFTVSDGRATTLPVSETTLSSRSPSIFGKSGLDVSITHWVSP